MPRRSPSRAGEDFAMLAATYSRASDALQAADIGWRNLQSLPNVMADVLKSPGKASTSSRARTPGRSCASPRPVTAFSSRFAGGPARGNHARHILMLVSDITPESGQVNPPPSTTSSAASTRASPTSPRMARLHSVDNSATAAATSAGDRRHRARIRKRP